MARGVGIGGVGLVLVALAGCPAPVAPQATLPSGIPVADLPPAQQALLRLSLAIDGGVLAETDLVLEGTAITGDVALNNVDADGDRVARLRLYGRQSADAAEVLLGEATRTVFIARNGESRIDFSAADVFDTCGATASPCALRFDVNRNGDSNLTDLLPADKGGRGIDPAPQAPVLDVAPSTLQFPSGVAVGTFARQVIVLENVGPSPTRVVQAEVVAAPGAGLSLFDPDGAPSSSAKRRLDGSLFPGPIAPGAEQLVAVSFAPANSFLTTGAVHVVVEDTVTAVRQTARIRLIGNPDGAVRVPGANDVDADPFAGDVDVPVFTWPLDRLASGAPATSADPTAADGLGLPAVGGTIALVDGGTVTADVAYLVELPAGQRLSVSLAGLQSDVDVRVLALDDGDVASGLACPGCASDNAGPSPEGVDLQNDTLSDRRLLVCLSRVDLDDAPRTVPFELSLLRSDAPSFVDDAPVSPATGPLEGGNPIVLIGRGWDPRATVRIGGNTALDVVVATDPATGLSTATCTAPAGPLDPSAASAVVVVQNPAIVDGGDGQAAVLPDGYLYQPPAPRLDSILPAVASTGTNTAAVQLLGAFFSRRGGAPVVLFDDVAVDGVFIDSSRIEVVPPSGRAAGTAFVTVRNRLGVVDGTELLSAPSAARPFAFLTATGPAPVVIGLDPAEASVDGGDEIVITGQNFGADAVVFLGGAVAPAVVESATRIVATVPARALGGRVDVVVQNGDGQATALRGGFSYVVLPPAIDTVFPDRASSTGGTLLSLAGTGYRPGARVNFVAAGGAATPAAGVSVVSGRLMLVGCPSLAAGSYDVVVTNLDGSTVTSTGFEVFTPVGPGPQLLSVDPAAGSAAGGTLVTLSGRTLFDVSVSVGAVVLPRQAVTLVRGVGGAPDTVRFQTPPSPGGATGVALVQVINGDGQSASTAFTYVAAGVGGPRIDAVNPGRISGTHDVTLTITGENLDAGATVLVGGVPVPTSVVGGAVTCVVGPRPRGNEAIVVINPDGSQATYPLEVTGPPVIAGLSTTSVHALVPGDQLIVIGDALDVDPIEDIRIIGPLGDEPGTVVQAANGFLVVEVPALEGDDAWSVEAAWQGGDVAASPQVFAAVEPTIESVDPVVVGGAVLLEVLGDALNPVRFDSVVLDATGLPTSTCAPLSRSERRVLCRPQPALVPGVDYGATLAWQGTFGGQTIPVTLEAVFVGTDAPVVVTGQTLTTSNADRPLPSDTSLAGITFTVTVPGASLQPQMTAIVDGVTLGTVTAVTGDVITISCGNVTFAPGTRPLVIASAGFDYAIGGTVTFAPSSVVSITPSTLSWSAGFTATGAFGAGDTLVAIRQDDPDTAIVLPTTTGDGSATCDDTTGLSAGAWTVCTTATRDACAGPTLVVEGLAAEIEGQANALTPGATSTGTFDGGGDLWFVHATAGAPIVATVDAGDACGAGTTVELLALAPRVREATGSRRLATSTVQPGGCVATAAAIAPVAGEYAVVVTMPAPTGGYGVTVDTDGTESEPNDVDGDVLTVDGGQACEGGTFGAATDADAWTFDLSAPQSIGIALDVGPACATPVRVSVSKNGAVLAQTTGRPGECPTLATPVLAPGGYVVTLTPAAAPTTPTSWTMTWTASRCGDGVVAGGEACDDGAAVGGDGCSSTCALEGDAICVGAPSRCVTDVVFVDDMEGGENGWTQQGFDAWGQVSAGGNTSWQWSMPADNDVQGTIVFDDVLISPALDFSLVDATGGVFFACGHRDDLLQPGTLVSVEVLTAEGAATPPGPVEPVVGYPRDGGWGGTGTGATVRDVFDLTPWAGATGVTIAIHAEGGSDDIKESRWFFDDVAVVGVLGEPTVPATWNCSASFFATGDGCDCGCGAFDPDCGDETLGSCDYCDNLGSCNGGGGCPGDIDPDNNAVCRPGE
jgi:cysteine-rich repeat protein